jgi:hypothetical protein
MVGTSTAATASASAAAIARLRARARRRFLGFYPGGFDDEDYLALERSYKASAARQWAERLSKDRLGELIGAGDYGAVASTAVRIEGRTNLLFSFEKMALRDALKTKAGARLFAEGIYELLHGAADPEERFERWLDALARLPRRQTRVFTWPVATVFPFLADPRRQIYLKPTVTKAAAARWGFPFQYVSSPSFAVYESLLAFGRSIRGDLQASGFPGRPRDQIDVQGFIWILGSSEYD